MEKKQDIKMLEDNELYRQQMAAISCAALGWQKRHESINPDYETVALRDVQDLYEKYEALHRQVNRPTRLKRIAAWLKFHLSIKGLQPGALIPEADTLDAIPEFQRGWYAQDPATKKFKVDFSKVDIEDVSGLKNTVNTLRTEAQKAKDAAEARVKEALKPFEGIDPVRTKAMLAAFASEEEKKLISQGEEGINKVIQSRMSKAREEMEVQITQANEKAEGAMEVINHLQTLVIDNFVRAAATEAGVHPGAIDDVLLRARQIFALNDDMNGAVQYEDDGETIVMGKDGKTPFTPMEWVLKMKEKAPHWFPASGSGGGAAGNKGGKPGGKDLSGLSPTERMTAAREAR